jgi:hypothetical protein
MGTEVVGLHLSLSFDFDETMISSDIHSKAVTPCNKVMFIRQTLRVPHVTLGSFISPFGDGPPTFFVLPSGRRVAEFEPFEQMGKLKAAHSLNGWMTAVMFVT